MTDIIGVKLEVAFGGSFYDDPALLTWTDLTSRWDDQGGLDVKLGRDSNLAAVPQAGTSTFVLTSNDGALMPGNVSGTYWPNVVSGVPIRQSAQDHTGAWWPVFYGLTEAWEPTLTGDDLPDWKVVTVTCVTAWTALTQAGPRRTYADRVVGDLNPARGESALGGAVSNVLYAGAYDGFPTSRSVYPAADLFTPSTYYTGGAWPNAYEPAGDGQRWGFAWLRLDDSGGKAWSVPGAACPVTETGGSDTTGLTTSTVTGRTPSTLNLVSGGFAGDRPGGQITFRADGTSSYSVGTDSVLGNFSRAQVMVGRPPTQLAPVGVSAPTSTTGWVSSVGAVSLVAATTLPHLPRSTAYDPTTGVTSSAVVNGPANAISWAAPSGSNTLKTPPIPVTAGACYGGILVTSGLQYTDLVAVVWLNSGGTQIGSPTYLGYDFGPGGNSPGTAGMVWGKNGDPLIAPTGAVNAQFVITRSAGATTVTVCCVGWYNYEITDTTSGAALTGGSPAQWWPIGADSHIYAWIQWPDLLTGGMTLGTSGQIRWIHVRIDVTSWYDGDLHLIAWNGFPGVAGKPIVLADNVPVTAGWSVSYPGANVGNDVAHPAAVDGSNANGGFGADSSAYSATVNPSKLYVPSVLLGAYPPSVQVPPSLESMDRAWSFFGGQRSLAGTVYGTDTGAQLTKALDELGWPVALRSIATGASTAPAESWTDLSSLSDYSALVGDLTAVEYGWVDIGPDGVLRWLPRAWYGTGTATAVAHYTWRRCGVGLGDLFTDIWSDTWPGTLGFVDTAGQVQYVPPLGVLWDDRYSLNSVIVANGNALMSRIRQDLTAQRRGLRQQTFTAPWGVQADMDAVADILQAVHAPGPRIESLVLRAVGSDDPMLAEILARKTGDVVLVSLPQLPAVDLVVGALIVSIDHVSDGVVWEATLGLSPCPIPVTM